MEWKQTRQYGNTIYTTGPYKVQKNNDNTAWEALSLFSPGTYQKLRTGFSTAKKAKTYCEEHMYSLLNSWLYWLNYENNQESDC